MDNYSQIDEQSSLFQAGYLIADRYEVVSPLGKGGMGMVLRVIDRTLDNEPTAIKILYPHHVSDPVIFARFRNEVLVARSLAHPNIVRLYDFGSAGKGYYYISMEYVQGYSLKDRIYSNHFDELTFPEICRILYEIGSGLAYAHKKGVIHRDIKPDNILLTPGGDVRITDFGLARTVAMDKGFTQTGETVGTPCYMAPEQISGSHVDARADIYSLGILAYEMATGHRPFEDESWYALAKMHMTKPLPHFAKEYNLPKWFEALVQQSGAKRVEERFQNMEEWCSELASHIGVVSGSAKKLSPAVFSTSFAKSFSDQRKRKALSNKIIKIAVPITIACAVSTVGLGAIRGIPTLKMSALSGLTAVGRATNKKLQGLKTLVGLPAPLTTQSFNRALDSDDLDTALLLVAGGLDLVALDESGELPLFRALEKGWVDLVARAAVSPGVVSLRDKEGNSLLTKASQLGAAGLALSLIDAGADIDDRDALGRTSLMIAANNGDLKTVQALMARGALLSLTDTTPEALPIAVYAIKGADPLVLKEILKKGGMSAANAVDSRKQTPLMYAAEQNNEELIKILIENGAMLDKKTSSGKTVRDFASGRIRQNYFSEAVVKSTGSQKLDSTASEEVKIKETTLRVIGEPDVEWQTGRSYMIRSLQVSVRNVGDEKANDVIAEAILPGGERIKLTGPEEITSNAVVTYQLSAVPKSVPSAGKVEVKLSCENCRVR